MRTEIFGSLGPACADQTILEAMFRAGMTGIRLNLSHTDLTDAREQITALHAAARAVGTEAQLVIDTQGPEVRMGALEAPVVLREGETVLLGTKALPMPAEVLSALEQDLELLLDDGKIALRILHDRTARVLRGGQLAGRKSIKLVDREISLPVLTPKDLENLKRAKTYGVTGVLQPFVRSGAELRQLRRLLAENGAGDLRIFAKIESRAGAEHLADILPEADVIVIARGDLGNDVPLWSLPALQKEIAAACRRAGKPFLVVTQMLASMERCAVPTRAEVSDIFNAVLDGAWGVMLTGETAVGQYPAEAIRYLARTACEAEAYRSAHDA